MSELTEHIFSFQDLLSPDQAGNQRWTELMEVIDQMFEEFVYPELEKTKKLKSIYTAEDEDLDKINIDRYSNLFEEIQSTVKKKRIALWMKQEIIRAKNKDDSILIAISSLGYPRDAVSILAYYSPKTGAYIRGNLRRIEAIEDISQYFMTSRTGVSLDRSAVFAGGQDPLKAEDEISKVLSENILPEHIDLLSISHSSTSGLTYSLGYTYLSKEIIVETVIIP